MILDHRGNVIRQSPSALMETAIRETQLCLVKNNTIAARFADQFDEGAD